MAPHLVLSRCNPSRTAEFNVSHVSFCSESEEWSTIDLYPQFPKEFNADNHCVRVVGHGNGLVLFYYKEFVGRYRDDVYVIWNPSTDKFQLIPHTDSRYLPCYCSSRRCVTQATLDACGLGFVAESHDYKFVRFMSNYSYDVGSHNWSERVAVYSSKNNSWKEVSFPFNLVCDGVYDITPGDSKVATCVNGICYWTTPKVAILSFDLSTDTFSTIPYPDDIAPDDFYPREDVFLLEFDGSLCLVIRFQLEKKTKLFCFWVYEFEYRLGSLPASPWTRKMNLDVRFDAETKPLWLGNKTINSLVLLLQGFDGSLQEYNYTTRELKKIDLTNDHHRSRMFISTNAENKNINSATCEFDGWRAHLRPHSKVKGSNDDVVDRISQLPDDMILCILSSLSIKEAASTSVLSTRWSELWRYIPNLNFPYTHLAKRYKSKLKYIKEVNSIVESHKALSLKEFNISFPLRNSTRTIVAKWLEFAFSRRVEVLELNLFGRSFDFLENSFLQERRIFESSNLKSLCMKCMKVSGEVIGLFLRNCPLLERLIIKYAYLTSDLEVCSGALKHLDIQYCDGENLITCHAPNLTCLKMGSCPFITDFVGHPKHQCDDDPLPLFCINSSQLTTLKFTLDRHPKGFLEKGFPQMHTLRKLIVTYHECEDEEINPTDKVQYVHCRHGIRTITSLISGFPYLEEFEIKCYTTRRTEQQGMEAAMTNNIFERFRHCHLRVFKFTWFDVRNGEHMELMSYILDNCVALQKIILDIYGVDSPSYVAVGEYAKQLQSIVPTHIQLIISFKV